MAVRYPFLDVLAWLRKYGKDISARELWELKVLYLRHLRLSVLPPEIGSLTNLKLLDVSDSNLSILPYEICELTNLTRLNASGNNLTSVPQNMDKLSLLSVLDLDRNKLSVVPMNICKMSADGILDIIYLEFNSGICTPFAFGCTDFCKFIYKLHVHILAKKYYYRWRCIVIIRRGFAKDYHEIFIMQNYLSVGW